MRLEVNGIEWANFVNATVELRLDSLSSRFAFEAVAPQGQPLPFKVGSSCRVIIGNDSVLTGFIEVVSVNYDGESHVINISGRDKTADLLDSSLDAIPDIRGDGLTLKGLIETVIDQLGLDIKVIDQVGLKPFSETEDIASPEAGDNAFSFLEKYARKQQVLLTSNGDGDIVIARNSGTNAVGAVQHIIGASDNNVLSSSFSYDTTGRYNVYRMASALNLIPLNLAGDSDLASVVNQRGEVSDSGIRRGRQLILVPETPYSDTSCKKRAEWEANVRKARGLVYSATVDGFRVDSTDPDSSLWSINRIYQIVDDFVGKIENMLCNSVVFSLDENSGSTTSLGFVGKNAYTQLIEDDPLAKIAENFG